MKRQVETLEEIKNCIASHALSTVMFCLISMGSRNYEDEW
jgi:hypothetical protein